MVVDVLEGGKAHPQQCGGQLLRPLQSFAVPAGAVSKPDGDAASQDALHHSAGVEGSEDVGLVPNFLSPSQEEEALICLLQHMHLCEQTM